MTINPLFDDSRWTLTPPCYCPTCTLARRKSMADYLRILEDVSLTIIYNRWPPAPPTPNLPARRKWIARRARITVNGNVILFGGWDLTAPSGRRRWYPTRQSMIDGARAFRTSEVHQTALDVITEIGIALIS